MKARRTMAMAVGAALLAVGAFAAPSVEITSVQQQYPWTNTVDIVYNVAGVESETNGYFVVFTPTTSTGAEILDVNGEKSVQVALKGSGVYSTQWFPQTNQQYTACKMTPSVFRGAAKDYMIVDLLTGAVTYEPMATQAASNERYQAAEYKTTKMVFRRIEAGTYDVLEGTQTAYMEKDFYVAIYPLTVGQYNAIMGSGATTSALPKCPLSWNEFRDSALSTARVPDTGRGCIAKMNAKIHKAGNGALYFDMPNQAMWEVACRAKCPANWCNYWGTTSRTDTTGMNEHAWWSGNSGGKVHDVGLKIPNDWGFYDMIGNVWEWTRDTFTQTSESSTALYSANMSFTQAPGYFGSNNAAAARGGHYGDTGGGWLRASSCVQRHYKTCTEAFHGSRFALICE